MKVGLRIFAGAFALAVAVLVAIGLAEGCTPGPSTADEAQVAAYGAELQLCLDEAKLHDAGISYYMGCRAEVRRRFAFDGGAP